LGWRLTGILDWEFAGWGDPDEDIGWLCCKGWRFARLDREAGGIAARASFYESYERAAGRRLDPERVRFWEVLANVRWAVIALQQSDRHLIGGVRDLSTAIIGRRATECDLELLLLLDPGGAPQRAPSPPPGERAGVRGRATDSAADLRDRPGGVGLLALGRELLDELQPLLPPERQRELRLVATAMAIAEREAIAGDARLCEILARLRAFYEAAEIEGEAPTPALPRLRGREGPAPPMANHLAWEGGGSGNELPDLLRRFAADLRAGAFEPCASRGRAARAILWRLTILKLREGNPGFLAAQGFGE